MALSKVERRIEFGDDEGHLHRRVEVFSQH